MPSCELADGFLILTCNRSSEGTCLGASTESSTPLDRPSAGAFAFSFAQAAMTSATACFSLCGCGCACGLEGFAEEANAL
eukprot:CAMPEP_0178442938 /NCGR_PEP_ID=MMETSP0689_2-20121128/38513_1 /TAXON_ID=160604 /ORGANISM="Amphidinium massartii, Strain CS-259" /LENGTH=79 /DNA_ID=CAMNT_0020066681 /DNA_START=336 /DNA_END=575 /DNA_ORIENTATION=-